MPGSGWLGFGGVESACFVFRVCFGVSRSALVVSVRRGFRVFSGRGGCVGRVRRGDAGCRVGLGFFGLVSPWQFSCSRVRHDSS